MGKARKRAAAVFCAVFCLTAASAAFASQAADWQDNIVLMASMEGSDEMTAIFNGYRVDTGAQGKIIIMPCADTVDAADQLMIVEGNGEIRPTASWSAMPEYGITLVPDASGKSGHPINQTTADLTAGQLLYVAGINFQDPNLDVENLSASMVMYETSLGQIENRESPIFATITDLASGMAGGPVFCENGDLAGILISDDEFILSSALFGTEPSGSGNGGISGGSGFGGAGSSGGGGNSEDILSQGLLTTVTGGSSFFLALIPIMGIVFIVSFVSYLNDEAQRRVAGEEEFVLQSVGSASLAVQGLGGYFGGKTIPISGKLVFGRDKKRCSVSYPADTKGVSGVHCQLEAGGDGAVITDLGSSYGTFLGNGTKLSPNQPVRLNKGDEFYLAVRDNTFRIV